MKTGWEVLTLKDLCSIQSGASDTKDAVAEGAYAFFDRSRAVKRSNRYLYDCDAIILPGEGQEFLPKRFEGKFDLHQRAYALFDFAPGLDPSYLNYFLLHRKAYWPEVAVGATVKSLRRRHFEMFEVIVPPLDEQNRIVAVLDEAFEAIATATANTEQSLINARKLITALREKCFSPQTRVDWRTDRLDDLANFRNGLNYTKGSNGESVTVVGVADFMDRTEVHTGVLAKVRIDGLLAPEDALKEGDILTVRSNGSKHLIGRTIIVPKLKEKIGYSGFLIRTRLKTSRIRPDYLAAFMRTSSMHSALVNTGNGTSISSLSQSALASLVISYPSLECQSAVMNALQRATRDGASLQNQFTRKALLLAELKSALLAQAFSGKLTAAPKVPPFARAPANNNDFSTPQQVANIIAFAYNRHATYRQQLTFGHVKAQKVLHLVEAVGGVELGRRAQKDAAGPNDFQHMLAAERWAKMNDFFEFVKEPGRHTFRKLAKYAERINAAEAALTPIKDQLERATALVVDLPSRGAEVLATVHAAWNNLILDGQEPTEEAIVRTARDEWHSDKLLIPMSEFHRAIDDIKKLGIVPNGSSKRVGEPRLL